MNRRVLAAVALAAMLLLAGCSSYLSDTAGEPTDESLSTVSPSGGAAATPTAKDDGGDASPTGTERTPTATEPTPPDGTDAETPTATDTDRPWSPPAEPNKPLEHALNGSQGNRIAELAHVDDGPGETASGDVTLAVRANTSMSNVDPADMGTVRGEPFFLVYVNGSLHHGGEWAGSSFYGVEGTRAVNTDQVAQREDGTFELTVPAGAFEAADAEGDVEVMVLLMDQDKQWDDVYGVANVTVDYELPQDEAEGTETGAEPTTNEDEPATDDAEPTPDDDEPATDTERTTTDSEPTIGE